ncbi:dnaJ homolog subfamily C member 30, mitochondrial-like [Rhodnius prolixus]|uniref:J domain-containing protein n=2 Tax=Rhodnius TaxID=13248 RepID=T1HR47_RHOPR
MNINLIGSTHRYFGLLCILYKNHYDALGLTPKATQGEIKAAYYKLSMIYHPDKNKGSDSANENFKAITAAYEVLGNFKLRRLYDRGLTIDSTHIKGWASPESQGNSTKGSRIQTTSGSFTGRTPIYDFDEWSRFHYGSTLERKAQAKAKYRDQFGSDSKTREVLQTENFVLTFVFLSISFFIFSYAYRYNVLDNPPDKSNNKK